MGSNRLNIALRNATNAIENLKNSDLGILFKKIAFRKGRQEAITAIVIKIAVTFWNMITKSLAYTTTNVYVFLDYVRTAIAQLRKKINMFGVDSNELGIFSKERYRLVLEKKIYYQGFNER